jgi:hypothetical protein
MRYVRLQKERPLSRIEGSRGATIATMLVGLAGFAAGVSELVDGELWPWVETVADVVGCSGCGTRAVGHGRHGQHRR